MPQCAAFGCTNRSDNTAVFQFPSDPLLRDEWINAVRRKDFIPTSASKICIEHFLDRDFETSPSLLKTLGIKKKLRLNRDAVPSIFPAIDQYKENQRPGETPGPKRKKSSHGAFQKRNRQKVVYLI